MRAVHVFEKTGLRLSAVPVIVTVLAVAGAGFGPAGCTSQKDKAKDKMLTQAATLRQGLQTIPPQLDEVSKRMFTAAQGQNPNRAQDVREFSKSLVTLREQARMVASEANKAEVDTDKYFTAWAQEARHSDLADQSTVRSGYKASRQQVDAARRLLDRARSDFRDLITSLDSVESKLKADQSENGIMAIQSDIGNAQVKTMDVKNYLARLTEAIDTALAAK